MANGTSTNQQLDATNEQQARDLVSLRDYIERRLSDMEALNGERFKSSKEAVATALSSAKEAVVKAEIATEKRFESVNEFRGQLNDQAATLMSRREYLGTHEAMLEKIDIINGRLNRMEGTTKGSEITMGRIYGAIAALGIILGIIITIAGLVSR